MTIVRTGVYDRWFGKLKDRRARGKIAARIARLEDGNPGDARSVGEGVVELRIDYGPGFRIYYVQRGKVLILLLCGGDKSTQPEDIRAARALAAEFERERRS